MKKLLLSFVMLAAVFALQSQTVIFQDNFDTYTAGQKLVQQNNTNWTTWSNAPGGPEDPMVSTEQSQTNPNSVKITGDNDLLYKFSNQTTGVYKVEFDYYIPSSGMGGYFNNQHYASPGQQWAVEVYFRPNGTGYLHAGSNDDINFTFPANQWFHVIFDVDLDNDNAILKINNTVAHTWPYHYQAGNQNGICQLGAMNFYAGYPGGSGGGGTMYFDNFKFTEIIAAVPGVFVINPETPIVETFPLSGGTKTINLSNTGGSPINYEVVAVYNIPNPISTSTGEKEITHVKAPGTSGVGFTNQNKYTVAAGYTPTMLKDHIGKTVRKYKVKLGNASNIISGKLCIWKMGSMGMPSLEPPIYEQTVSSFIDGENTITLTTPYLIDGGYVYIGLDLNVVPGDNTSFVSIGTDLTPDSQCNKLGRLYRSSVAWTSISGLAGYWEMYIYVDGTPIEPWMALTNPTATLAPAANKDLKITFGAPDITESCKKTGQLYFFSTDFLKEETSIDVTAQFGTFPNIDVTPLAITKEILEGDVNVITETITVANTGTAGGTYKAEVKDGLGGWLTLTGDVEGTVPAGGAKTFIAGIDGSKLTVGEYEDDIIVSTNDTEHPSLSVSVKLIVGENGIDTYNFIQTLYPNPASGIVNIVSNSVINSIEIINYLGQVVYSATVNEKIATADISRLSAGTYVIRVHSEGHIQSSKLMVK